MAAHESAVLRVRGMVRAEVTWPADDAAAMLVFVGDAHGALVCRVLGQRLQAVTLDAACVTARDAETVLDWAGDHAGELGGVSDRLLVAGLHDGARRAACLADRARAAGWPGVAGQLLIHPHASNPVGAAAGTPPAAIVGGRTYAERLRRAGVQVTHLDRGDPFLSAAPSSSCEQQLCALADAALADGLLRRTAAPGGVLDVTVA